MCKFLLLSKASSVNLFNLSTGDIMCPIMKTSSSSTKRGGRHLMEQVLRGHLPFTVIGAISRLWHEHEPHVYVISVVIATPPDRRSNAKWRKMENYIWVTTSA